MKSHMVEHLDTGLLIVCFLRVTIHKNPVRQNQIQQYMCGTFLVSGSGLRNQENHSMFSFEAAVLKREDLFTLDVGEFMDLLYFQKKKKKINV